MSLAEDGQWVTVREAMDRVGLILFPDQWTGKEYLDHWRLGLNPWPPTKLRGMQAVRELLSLVWAERVVVEVETGPDVYEPIDPAKVRHFHGGRSMVGEEDEIYHPCRLKFPPALPVAMTSKGGRKGYDYPPIVIRILDYLDRHGLTKSPDEITRSLRIEMDAAGEAAPSYSRLQPFVSALLAYRLTREQKFLESIPGSEACDEQATEG